VSDDPLLTLADAARQYAFAYNAERARETTFIACPTEESKDALMRAQRRTRNRAEDVLAAALRANGVQADRTTFVVDV
jgi:hypothetical protein